MHCASISRPRCRPDDDGLLFELPGTARSSTVKASSIPSFTIRCILGYISFRIAVNFLTGGRVTRERSSIVLRAFKRPAVLSHRQQERCRRCGESSRSHGRRGRRLEPTALRKDGLLALARRASGADDSRLGGFRGPWKTGLEKVRSPCEHRDEAVIGPRPRGSAWPLRHCGAEESGAGAPLWAPSIASDRKLKPSVRLKPLL